MRTGLARYAGLNANFCTRCCPCCPILDPPFCLRSCPVVVAENAADSLAPADSARRSLRGQTVCQLIGKALVIPLAMVMGDELPQSPTKVPFAEREDSIQTFLFHRSDKSFCMSIAVRRTRRRSDDANARRGEPLLHRPAPLRHGPTPRSPEAPLRTWATTCEMRRTIATASGHPTSFRMADWRALCSSPASYACPIAFSLATTWSSLPPTLASICRAPTSSRGSM